MAKKTKSHDVSGGVSARVLFTHSFSRKQFWVPVSIDRSFLLTESGKKIAQLHDEESQGDLDIDSDHLEAWLLANRPEVVVGWPRAEFAACLVETKKGMSVRDLADHCDVPVAAVRKALAPLVAAKLVEIGDGDLYRVRPGVKLYT